MASVRAAFFSYKFFKSLSSWSGTCYGLRRRNIKTRNMTQKALHSSCNSSQRVTPAYNIQDFDRTGTDRSSYARGASLIVSKMRIKQQWKLDQDLPKLSNRREADDSQLQLFVDIWNRRRRRSDYQHILVRPLQHLRGWFVLQYGIACVDQPTLCTSGRPPCLPNKNERYSETSLPTRLKIRQERSEQNSLTASEIGVMIFTFSFVGSD